jgi:hypothetical protein
MAHISTHAAERYIERFDRRLTVEQARELLMRSAAIIDAASRYGAESVKLGNGARLILRGDVVATVKQAHKQNKAPASRTMLKRWRRRAAAES